MASSIRWLGKPRSGKDREPVLRGNPLTLLADTVGEREMLCDQLEAIADSLPNSLDRTVVLSATRFLRHKVPAYHRDERDCLFPMLERRAPQSFGMNGIAMMMQNCQVDDEDYAFELADILETLADQQRVGNPDATGYMLRGFFQSYRRYLAWQRLTILPLAAHVLSAKDLENLLEAIYWTRSAGGPPKLYLVPDGSRMA